MDNIEIFLRKAVKDGVFPGCCAVIIHNHEHHFYCAGNRAIFPAPILNTMDTMYDMASFTNDGKPPFYTGHTCKKDSP